MSDAKKSQLSDAAIRQLRSALEAPDLGDRFETVALVGHGGMGRVYRVHDRTLDRDVALKVLSLDAETPDLIERLVRESRVIARLEHPGIAAVHDAGTLPDGRPYYIMRLVRGHDLTDAALIGSRGERLRVFLRICDAVAFAHARGVVHRDLTPGNVMIGEYGDVVVLDWGVAKLLRDELAGESEGLVIGTRGFMAPEQATGADHAVDIRSDVYSLGALLRHLLGQATPLPRPLAAIVLRAMAPSPVARYQHVEMLAADVRRWLDAEPVSAYSESLSERAARFYQRNRALLALLAAYVVVRLTILIWRGV